MEQNSNKQGHQSEESLGRLRRVAGLAPKDPELRLALAQALLENSLPDEAIDQLRSVITMSPNHLEARKLLDITSQEPSCTRETTAPPSPTPATQSNPSRRQ